MNKKKSIYRLPDGWAELEIKEVSLKINYGYTAKSISNDTGTKFLRISDIQDGQVNWNTVPYCNIEKSNKYKFILDKGDIVFARTGATVGKSYLIGEIIHDTIFASYLIRIKLSKQINPNYIYKYFQSANYWKQIGIKALGVGQPHVNASSLSKLRLPLPPLDEQIQIVAKIEELFSELDHAQKGLQKAKQQLVMYRQTLLKSSFNGNLTAKWRNDKNTENDKHSSTQKLPAGWKLSILYEEGNLISGQHILKKDYNSNIDGMPYFTGPSDFGTKYPIVSKWTTNPKVLIKKGDVLITVKGSGLGKLNIAQEESTIGRQLMAFDFKAGSKLYIYYYLLFIAQKLKALGIGSAIPGINRESILNINCPIPTQKEQNKIVEILESRFTLIENLEKAINKSLNSVDVFRYSILKKAFEGKLVNQNPSVEFAKILLQKIIIEKEAYLLAQKQAEKLKSKKKRQMEAKKTVLEILKESESPISTQDLWQKSKYAGDIESFYNEIKSIYNQIDEMKKDTESFLSLKK